MQKIQFQLDQTGQSGDNGMPADIPKLDAAPNPQQGQRKKVTIRNRMNYQQPINLVVNGVTEDTLWIAPSGSIPGVYEDEIILPMGRGLYIN